VSLTLVVGTILIFAVFSGCREAASGAWSRYACIGLNYRGYGSNYIVLSRLIIRQSVITAQQTYCVTFSLRMRKENTFPFAPKSPKVLIFKIRKVSSHVSLSLSYIIIAKITCIYYMYYMRRGRLWEHSTSATQLQQYMCNEKYKFPIIGNDINFRTLARFEKHRSKVEYREHSGLLWIFFTMYKLAPYVEGGPASRQTLHFPTLGRLNP
jgi:hypothetical protein